MGNQQSSLSSKISLREPKNYKVVFYNDDFTTMDFVIEILILVFLKSEHDAYNIMLDIHHKGKSTVGTYSFDMARTRTMRATEMARAQGFPLKITIEPE
ncbi:MAG: ATP-dependent Clp protease adaptor ClpS [Muribaculaceae bacterium]